MDEKRAKNVVAMLRAVLQSSKEGVLASRVQGEYRGITGEFLPYKQLGFHSLDAYMQSIPDVARIARNREGEVVYHAVADASTLHIQRLKAGEKSNKRRKPSKGFKYNLQRRPAQTHNRFSRKPPSPHFPRFHPSPKTFGGRPSYFNRPQPITSFVTSYLNRPQPIRSSVPSFVNRPQPIRSSVPSYVSRPQQSGSSFTRPASVPQPSKPAIGHQQGERKSSVDVPPRFQRQNEQTQNTANNTPLSTATSAQAVSSTSPVLALGIYRSLLSQYCQKFSLPPPQYVTTLELVPGRENRFIGQVTVNDMVFRCPESEGTTLKKDAMMAAAKMALEHFGVTVQLNKVPETTKLPVQETQTTARPVPLSETKKPSCEVTQSEPKKTQPVPAPPKALPRTKGEEELAKMIKQLFKNRPKGIWAARLPAEFKARFKEDFPDYAKNKLQFWPDVVRTDSYNGPVIYFPVEETAEETTTREEHPKPQQNLNGNHPPKTDNNEFLAKMMNKFQHTKTMSITIEGSGKVEEEEETEQLSSLKSVVSVVVRPAELPSVGTKLQVFVSHFESPDCFYVHSKDCAVDDIQRVMTELYKDEWVSSPSSYSLGTCCAAQFTQDDSWCRAVLTQPPGGAVEQGEDCCFVQYVDFGNSEFVGKKRIQRLVVRAVQHPAQALPCQLHMVQSNQTWSQAAKDRFQELTREDVELTMSVTAAEGDRCAVHLQLPGGEDVVDRLVREQLLPLSLPDTVPLPDEQFLQVLVVDCNNTTEVVVRISEESFRAELKEFVREMTEYYNTNTSPAPDKVLEGYIYAAFEATEGVWCRVQAVDVEDDMVKCYFLDFGDTDVLTVSSLRLLNLRFSTQPVQVLKVQLAGLQDFSTDPEVLSKLFDLVAGKNCFAEIEERGPVPVVTFYDTGTDEDINVNELCLSVVDARDLAPTIPGIGEKLAGNVQFVDSSGLIYFTSPGPGLDKLEELMATADQQTSVTEAGVTSPELGKIYYSWFSQDHCWYRAEVTALLAEDKVSVRYVDFGNCETVEKSSLRSLQSNPQLACLPPQALRCRLSELPPEGGEWTQVGANFLTCLCKEADEDTICTIQPVQEPTIDGVLTVEMVLTSGDQVCQVNRYLQEQPHLFSPAQPGAKSDKLNNNLAKSRPTSVASVSQNSRSSRSVSPCSSVSSGSVFASPCTSPVPTCISQKPDVVSSTFYNLPSNQNSALEEDTALADRISQLNVVEDQEAMDISHPDNLSSPRVPTLDLPGKGRMLNMYIEDAIGPDHFVLRPFDNMELVEKLESDMDDFYENNVFPATDCAPKAGALYAAFVEDTDTWQRVCVKDIAQNGDVSIWGLDKGGYHVVSPSNLRPLDGQFCVLPAQAMMGQLGGVAPAKGPKWAPSAEELFCELVQKKAFIGLLLSAPRYAGRKGHFRQVSLKLRLIDTSNSDRDILIEDILVSKGHAQVLSK
ncbi:tudor domain-containing protein 7-like isoform X2 [Branchiostoma lanceolatum]|uniref:tudor domain-containing protein 7-like isoform X2 n=1 Tax=Branchiostoma lanceolatum TaxID=7740 RepID=UPI00345412FC